MTVPTESRMLRLTPAARAHIEMLARMVNANRDNAASLGVNIGMQVRSADGVCQFDYQGEHFFIGGYPLAKCPPDSFLSIGAQRVSIDEQVFIALRGRILDLIEVIDGTHDGSQQLLIAR